MMAHCRAEDAQTAKAALRCHRAVIAFLRPPGVLSCQETWEKARETVGDLWGDVPGESQPRGMDYQL